MRRFLNIAKALSDESRVRALLALRDGEVCVCELTEMLDLAPSTVSKHMSVLMQAELVECRKEGRWHYYRLAGPQAPPAIAATQQWLQALAGSSKTAAADRKRLTKIRHCGRKTAAKCTEK